VRIVLVNFNMFAKGDTDRSWPFATDANALTLRPLSGAERKSAAYRQEPATTRLTQNGHCLTVR
jgi:hypothetical protein